MAKIKGAHLSAIETMARTFMANGDNWADKQAKDCAMVESGALAWTIAHKAGIVSYCYGDTSRDIAGIPGCVDSHIRTALKGIFPNAWPKDSSQ